MSKELTTVGEAAEILSISTQSVRRLENEGTLPAIRKNGKDRLFRKEDIKQYKNNRPLKVSEAASELHMSISTLRRIEKAGQINPLRTPTGHRQYTKAIIVDFKQDKARQEKALSKQSVELLQHKQVTPVITTLPPAEPPQPPTHTITQPPQPKKSNLPTLAALITIVAFTFLARASLKVKGSLEQQTDSLVASLRSNPHLDLIPSTNPDEGAVLAFTEESLNHVLIFNTPVTFPKILPVMA